jgi:hypothetical protein
VRPLFIGEAGIEVRLVFNDSNADMISFELSSRILTEENNKFLKLKKMHQLG